MWFPHRFGALTRWANLGWQWLRPWRERLVPDRGPARPLMLGLFWGWLPCGLSTTLLTAAWLEASALHGGLLMLAFGLGTLPSMTALSWSGARYATALSRPGWRRVAAGLIAGAGTLTLLAPWLVHAPALHAWLRALGCRSLVAG
jgi:sulfite exporter TauE/SafE